MVNTIAGALLVRRLSNNKEPKSIWDMKGTLRYSQLTAFQREELMDLKREMIAFFAVTGIFQVKGILDKLIKADSYFSSNVWIDEWDVKNYAIIVQDYCVRNDTNIDEIIAEYEQMKDKIDLAKSMIAGVFENAKIWDGHRKVLSSYREQLSNGIPLTERQEKKLFGIISRYSKQMVTRSLDIF